MPVLALLLLGAGFFVQVSKISAQEAISPVEDPILAAEQALTLEEGVQGTGGTVSGPSIWTVVRMILTLALAAAAIYGVVFFIKKAARKTGSKDPFLKILASAHLGYNRYAHVVAVGSKAWLLGSSDGGVNLIGEIEDKDILNAMLLEDSQKSAEVTTGRIPVFTAMLRRLGMPAGSRAPGAADIRKHRERIKGL